MGAPRAHRVAAAAVFVLCFGAYVAGLCPSMYWLDSSELAAAAFGLGVAHPPGHPLATLLGKAVTLLPLGSVALRVGLASALEGAGAAALVTLLGAALASRLAAGARGGASLPPGERRALPTGGAGEVEALLGAAAGLAFGLSYAAAFQAVRPEVYALNVLLLVGAALSLVRADGTRAHARRAVHVAALCVGLALANHHLLALLFAPAALLLAVVHMHKRSLLPAALVLVAGVALYALLPLRAARHPVVDWGVPSTLARWWWTVTAKAFQKSVRHASAASGFDVAVVAAEELGLLWPLVPLGLYLVVRFAGARRVGLALALGAACNVAAPALVGFDRENPDAYGYLEPAVALLAILGAAAPAALLALVRSQNARRALAATLPLAVALFALRDTARWSRARFADTERWSRAALDAAPPRAALVTTHFQSAFTTWYLQSVEGRRPDVEHLHRHFLGNPGYAEETLARLPGLAPLVDGHALADSARLLEAARARPLLLEYDLDLDPLLAAALDPLGTIERLRPTPLDRAQLERRESAAAAARAALPVDRGEPQTRRTLLWTDFLTAARACRLAPPARAAAAAAITDARALLGGDDVELEALAAACLGAPR